MPLVSIVICVYNAGDFFAAALHSALAQTYENIEIIIIDDGSTDSALEALAHVSDRRIRFLSQQNAGKPVALNRALGLLKGDFYCVLDADDEMHPERVLKQAHTLQENRDLAAVFSGHHLIMGSKRIAPRARHVDRTQCRNLINQFAMPAHDPTAMFRIEMVKNIQYEPSLRIGHGVDYVIRVGEQFPMLVLGECLYGYRIHMSSLTKQDPYARIAEVETIIKRACNRRGLSVEDYVFKHRSSLKRIGKNALRDNNLAADFIESTLDQIRMNHRWGAMKTGAYCAMLHPLDIHYYKPLIYSILPDNFVSYIRNSN
ncbi:MAG: glycosyltransferase family 2 protein [Candidatus Hydrogenedentes bacterium]|nr:glycosyltransferase family 2 protein [Candidatus Hydrogenedentota bacterium]